MRVNWNEYFLKIAMVVSERSPCLNIRVGAVITYKNKILSTGYNGTPGGIEHCRTCNKYDNHCYKAVHAEANAIIQCNDVTTLKELKLYTIYSPCIDCSKLILNTGINEIYYIKEYSDSRDNAMKLLSNNGVSAKQIIMEV